ncbi:MAG: ArnT family glycosyltransferase [Thermoleophilia bacterium]
MTSPAIILALIIIAAAVIRAWAAHTHPLIMNDETVYARMAQNLRAGHLPWDITGNADTIWTPLLPMTMAALMTIVHSAVTTGYIIDIVFGSLLLIPTFLLGTEMVNRRVGLMAAALMAVSPLFVDYSSMIYSESMYIFFFLFGIYFGWRLLTQKTWTAGLLAGISLGFAYVANPTAIGYLAILALLALVVAHVSHSWRRMLKPVLLMVIVFFVIGAPYIFFLHSQLHQWTFTGKDVSGKSAALDHGWDNQTTWNDGALALTPDGTETQIDYVVQTSGGESTLAALFHHPGQRLRTFFQDLRDFEQDLPHVFFIGLLPLLGLGLFMNAWNLARAKRVGYTFLLILPVIPMLSVWFDNARFFMPFVPLVMIWIANGWRQLEIWGQQTLAQCLKSGRKSSLVRLAPWIVGFLVLVPILPVMRSTVLAESYPVGMKAAGEAIRSGAVGQKRLMGLDVSPAYYAGDDSVELPDGSYKQITAYAREYHVDYLVIDKGEIKQWRPQLGVLLQTDASHPDWRLLTVLDPGTDNETFVFELQK